jgi:putative ABC transport system permease protein
LRLIVGHGFTLTVTALVLGVVGSLATTQVLRAYLFEVGPRDPLVLSAVGLVLVATALVASYLPARRATRVDPMVALRSE